MDLALAIHKHNPAGQYRLSDDKTRIIEWRGPGPQPTQAQLEAAWAAVQAEQVPPPDFAALEAAFDAATTLATVKAAVKEYLRAVRRA